MSWRRRTETTKIEPVLRLFSIAVVLLTCAVLVPGITRPFDATEPNAGWYFGAIVGNLDRHGFLELRGTPLYYTLLEDPRIGTPYLNHPPGLSWLLWLFGPREWQMRLCTLLATIAAALGLVALARPRFGEVRAGVAGCLFVVVPAVAVFSQVTYEAVALAFGTWMLVAIARQRDRGRPRPLLVAVSAACAFCGTWIDWGFAAFCLGAVPVAWSGGVRASIARLVAPGIAGVVAIASVLAWKASLVGAPNLPDTSTANLGFDELIRGAITERPPWGAFFEAWGRNLVQCFTWPVLIAAIPGFVGVWRRDRGLAIGLVVAGAFVPALFGHHVVSGHRLYFAYFAPVFALSTAVAAAWIACWHEHVALRVVLIGALGVPPLWETLQSRWIGATTFYRDLGAVVSAATTEVTPEGTKRFNVVHNALPYGAYFDNEHAIFTPIADPAVLAQGIASIEADLGVKYLWVRADAEPMWSGQERTDLVAWLAQFPRERRPELEVEWAYDPPTRSWVTIREAWLYTIRDARAVR